MKAMLFAAGVGSRLGSETSLRPKCLVEVAGKPLLEYVIERLKACGVTDVMINIHHFADMIREFVYKQRSFNINVEFSPEDALLDTGGGLKKVHDFFKNEKDFIVHNCDIYCEYPLPNLLQAHRSEDRVATLLVMKRDTQRGLYFNSKNELVGWSAEKNSMDPANTTLLGFCGVQVVSPKLFEFMPNEQKFSIIQPYLEASRSGHKIIGHNLNAAYWIDVGKPAQLQELRERLAP